MRKDVNKEQRLLRWVRTLFDRTNFIILDENINRLFGFPGETMVTEVWFNSVSFLGLGVSSIGCVATSNLRYCSAFSLCISLYEMRELSGWLGNGSYLTSSVLLWKLTGVQAETEALFTIENCAGPKLLGVECNRYSNSMEFFSYLLVRNLLFVQY